MIERYRHTPARPDQRMDLSRCSYDLDKIKAETWKHQRSKLSLYIGRYKTSSSKPFATFKFTASSDLEALKHVQRVLKGRLVP